MVRLNSCKELLIQEIGMNTDCSKNTVIAFHDNCGSTDCEEVKKC